MTKVILVFLKNIKTKVLGKKYTGQIASYQFVDAKWVNRGYIYMDSINAKCDKRQKSKYESPEVATGSLKKYTYVLPSGRKLKVIVDDGRDCAETACSSPSFLLRIDDETEG